jgi:hypothetical protein
MERNGTTLPFLHGAEGNTNSAGSERLDTVRHKDTYYMLKHHAMEAYGRSEDNAPFILNLGTK